MTQHTLTTKLPERIMNEHSQPIQIRFFALKDKVLGTCEGAGFEVVGNQATTFHTLSDSDMLTVYDHAEKAHHLRHLLERGLWFGNSSANLFVQEWEKAWYAYKGIRSQYPPATYTFAEARKVISNTSAAYLRALL